MFFGVNLSLFFFNVELFFLIIIFLLIFFTLGKGLTLQFRRFLNYTFDDLFVLIFSRHFLIFLLFFISVYFFLIVSLFDKRFFFFDFNFLSDSYIVITKILLLFSFSFVLYVSRDNYIFELMLKSFEYYFLLILNLLSFFFLLSANDFLSLYVTVEFQSLSLYVLAALKQNSLFSIEAGLKYFILGTFSSGLLLFGISLLYGITGTLNFFELDSMFQFDLSFKNDFLFKLGLLFFFSSLLFKFSAAPFHMWAPDVYHGAPSILTFFFSLTPKIAFLVLFVRLVFFLFSSFEVYFQFLFFLSGLCSVLIGSLASIFQIKLKRLLAYSSIANIGYVLMGLCIGQIEGLSSSFIYFFIYIFALSSIFAIFLGLRYFSNNFEIRSIFEFMGLLNFNFVGSIVIILGLFSLLGLPPLAGFLGKFYLFLISLGSEFFFFLYISIFGSVLSTVIYLRMIRLLLFNKYNNIFFFHPFSFYISLFSAFLLLINFIVFFFPTNFFVFVFNIIVSFLKSSYIFSFCIF